MTKNINFLTYFTKEFLIQGTVAIESFLKFHHGGTGFVICLDDTSAEYLRRKKYSDEIKIYELKEIPSISEMFERFLLTRTFVESIISIKPILIDKFIRQIPVDEGLVYFDADIFFFDSLARIESIINNSELVLSEHLFPDYMAGSQVYGIYNGGFIVFKNSRISIAILQTWKKLCIEWCELILHENKFADQKYLEQFVTLGVVKVIRDPGINNGQYYFREHRELRFSKSKNVVTLDNFSLICFHFHGIGIHKQFISTGFNRYGLVKKPLIILLRIYLPYIRAIKREITYARDVRNMDFANIVIPSNRTSKLRAIWQILKFTLAPYRQKNSKSIIARQ
jgi:hypothetical protein